MSSDFKNRQKELRLENALNTMATVIELYGDVYWPVFESLERLLEAERSRRQSLSKYRSPSNLGSVQFGASLESERPILPGRVIQFRNDI